jgi:hypothetical protein
MVLFTTNTILSVADPLLHASIAVPAFAASSAVHNSHVFVIGSELFHPTPENNLPIIEVRVYQ